MTDAYYPPPGFHFTLTVLGSATALSLLTGTDAAFQEISGIQATKQSEEVVEGGENRFVHRLPKQTKYSNLVLKRGAVVGDSFLVEWAGLTVGASLCIPVVTQNILVTLLGESGIPLIAWAFVNAYPVKTDIAGLNAMDNKILIESLELSYNYYERVNLGGLASAAVQIASLAARLATMN
ncbi:MAG: phage tail protein [Rhizomicrobium sp.]